MPFFPLGGLYPEPRRNQPVELRPANPLPANRMDAESGNAGLDGYSVLSRADRFCGQRPSINGRPVFEGPQPEEY